MENANNSNLSAEQTGDKSGILRDFSGKENLLVAFGGIRQGLGIPVFEFFKSLQDIPCDKLFFRDFNQTWYQKGVDAELNSVDKIVAFLENEIESNNYKKVCFMGNSMGGYAAILFGSILDVDAIYAFAPQTFVNRANRLRHFDFRWSKQINNIQRKKSNTYLDLAEHLKLRGNFSSKIQVYYSNNHRLDTIHARRMKGFKNVELIEYSKGGHDVVKSLRDEGILRKIILDAFQLEK